MLRGQGEKEREREEGKQEHLTKSKGDFWESNLSCCISAQLNPAPVLAKSDELSIS